MIYGAVKKKADYRATGKVVDMEYYLRVRLHVLSYSVMPGNDFPDHAVEHPTFESTILMERKGVVCSKPLDALDRNPLTPFRALLQAGN